ncbi:hypothetical protein E4U15_007071, partial [Claviceps sp. LM218 group G6]
MSSQFTFSSWQPAASAAPTVSTSTDSNTADHGNNVAPTSSYYNGVTWNKIYGAYGPTADSVGVVRSCIWKHGWKIESLVDKKLFWKVPQKRTISEAFGTATPSTPSFQNAID